MIEMVSISELWNRWIFWKSNKWIKQSSFMQATLAQYWTTNLYMSTEDGRYADLIIFKLHGKCPWRQIHMLKWKRGISSKSSILYQCYQIHKIVLKITYSPKVTRAKGAIRNSMSMYEWHMQYIDTDTNQSMNRLSYIFIHEASGILCVFIDISVSTILLAQRVNLRVLHYHASVVYPSRRLATLPPLNNDSRRPTHQRLWLRYIFVLYYIWVQMKILKLPGFM
jgi:hypothetical protein